MKERPILFSAPMVTALRAGRKTQTRRLVRLRDGSLPQEDDIARHFDESFHHFMDFSKASPYWQPLPCPQGQPGDRLWVQENYRLNLSDDRWVHYAADGPPTEGWQPWLHPTPADLAKLARRKTHVGNLTPGRFMYRSLSRLTLEIVSIRAEPLQDTTEADALAEGMDAATAAAIMHPEELVTLAAADILAPHAKSRIIFETVWDTIHGPGSWKENPWVWVINFQPMNAESIRDGQRPD